MSRKSIHMVAQERNEARADLSRVQSELKALKRRYDKVHEKADGLDLERVKLMRIIRAYHLKYGDLDFTAPFNEFDQEIDLTFETFTPPASDHVMARARVKRESPFGTLLHVLGVLDVE